jgi:hypothetical protein
MIQYVVEEVPCFKQEGDSCFKEGYASSKQEPVFQEVVLEPNMQPNSDFPPDGGADSDEDRNGDSDEESELDDHREYYDFLREMAGSFEQAASEADSEEEDEEDQVPPSDDEDAGFPEESEESTDTPTRERREISAGERERLALLACGDGPIIDGYDMIEAQAQQRVGSAEDQRREGLQAEIKMKLRQASQLWHRIQHDQDGKESEIIRHYGQVCAKILLEVSGLRAELHCLPGNGDSETIPIPEFEATFMQMIMKTFLLYVEEQVKKDQAPDQGSENRDEPCTAVVEWLYCELSPARMEVPASKVAVGEGWKLLGQDVLASQQPLCMY